MSKTIETLKGLLEQANKVIMEAEQEEQGMQEKERNICCPAERAYAKKDWEK